MAATSKDYERFVENFQVLLKRYAPGHLQEFIFTDRRTLGIETPEGKRVLLETEDYLDALSGLKELHFLDLYLYENLRISLWRQHELIKRYENDDAKAFLNLLNHLDLHISGRKLGTIDAFESDYFAFKKARTEFIQITSDYKSDPGHSIRRADQLMQDTINMRGVPFAIPRRPAKIIAPILIILVTLRMVNYLLTMRELLATVNIGQVFSDFSWLRDSYLAILITFLYSAFPIGAVYYYVTHMDNLGLRSKVAAGVIIITQFGLIWLGCKLRKEYLKQI